MPDENAPFDPIDPVVRTRLEEHWLPDVRSIIDQRKPLRRIMLGLLLTLVIVLLAISGYHIYQGNDISVQQGSIIAILMTAIAVVFVYIGKLQACDDVIPLVTCAVYIGCKNQLATSIQRLECYGNFEGLINNVKSILAQS